MSIVVNIVSQTASWIAADGRASHNGIIVSENTPKIRKINEHVCVGYTGTLETAEKILDKLSAPERKAAFDVADCKSVAVAICTIVNMSTIAESSKAQFVITGVNRGYKMASYSIGFDGNIHEHIPTNTDPLKTIELSNCTHGLALSDYVLPEIGTYGVCTNAMKIGMERFIEAVSKRDNSVNTNVTFLALSAPNRPEYMFQCE